MIDPLSDAKIVDSWHKNARPWSDTIRDDALESRRLVTNAAVVESVMSRAPRTALDIGCGEGWLARALAQRGVEVVGVDVVPALVERARQLGGGDFRVLSYEEIAAGALDARVDVAVANFALLGKESVEGLLRGVPALLMPGGALIIQTLHPVVASGELPYVDGWRAGSWKGFHAEFTDPPPWYFRTMGSWLRLLAASGFRVTQVMEPIHPATGQPASVLFTAEP